MANKDAVKKLKAFLESTPPGVPVCIPELAEEKSRNPMVLIPNPGTYWRVLAVAPAILELHCDVDDGVRRFYASKKNAPGPGFRFLEYVCRDCGAFQKTYALLTDLKHGNGEPTTVEIMKLGEYPPFGAPISARIQKLLDKDDLGLYRKGSRSEAQGLGIGAATYFRRIVESHWKLLVKELRSAAEKLGHADLAVFDNALQAPQFSTAVKMLKDDIPAKLLILNGENPLTLLYSPLSVQLHELTDEQCLQQAADIRTVLTALLENISDVLKDQEELQSAANRLKQIKKPEL